MATPAKPNPAGSDETVRALVGEFYEERKKEVTREVSVHQSPRRRSPGITIFAVIVCAAVWLLPLMRQDIYIPSPERVDASARMQVFLAAQRVFAYQKSTGRLPADLQQAGVDSNGLTYWRSTDSLFELRVVAGGVPVAYKSTMPPSEFLGNTFQVLGANR